MRYAFIAEHEGRHQVKRMCRVMRVSSSGYYAWRARPQSMHDRVDDELAELIKDVFEAERKRYGSPRIRARLQRMGHRHSRKRIARLMAKNGLFARKKRRGKSTTKANPNHVHAANLLNREFSADAPNRKWVSDIKQILTDEGIVYLGSTVDLYARRVVGWAMDETMSASLTRSALRMAIKHRRPQAGALHHSDRGSQYSDGGYRADLSASGQVQSMSRKGNVWDNAVMESFFATLEKELLAGRKFATRQQAMTQVFYWIEAVYNRTRMHSTLGYLSPEEFEAKYWHAVTI